MKKPKFKTRKYVGHVCSLFIAWSMKVSWCNLCFMWFHVWWLTARSHQDSCLLIQQRGSYSDCRGIAAGWGGCFSTLYINSRTWWFWFQVWNNFLLQTLPERVASLLLAKTCTERKPFTHTLTPTASFRVTHHLDVCVFRLWEEIPGENTSMWITYKLHSEKKLPSSRNRWGNFLLDKIRKEIL